MNILVTGVAGYLGSVLAQRLLQAGHTVRGVDALLYTGDALLGLYPHESFTFQKGDLRDPDVRKAALADIDAVVHLAAIVGDPACARDKDASREINTNASITLHDDAASQGVKRFIFASTCSNYGKMTDPDALVDETSELRPVSHYAETKVAVEKKLLAHDPSAAPTTTVLRFATLYGISPRMRFDLTVNQFPMELLHDGHLVVFGEQFWRPYVHVADAARAIQTILDTEPTTVASEVFNVGDSDQNFRKLDLIEMLREQLGADIKIDLVHKDEDPRDYRVSFAKIHDAAGFTITRTVPEGIAEVIQTLKDGTIAEPKLDKYGN